MRRQLPWLLATLTISCAIVPANGQESDDVTDIRVIDQLDPDGPYKRIWQPFIEKWTDEHLLATSCLELRGKFDMGDIACLISLDAGKSWGPRIMIFDHRERNGTVQYAYNNAVLFRPPGHDVVWCFAMRTPLHFRDSEDAHLCAAYTADGGYSWTPVELAMDYHGPLITNAGIVPVPDEMGTRYLLGVHRNTKRHDSGGDRQQFVLESRSLLRWKLAAYIPNSTEHPAWLHEGNIAVGDGQGELKMVMRTAGLNRSDPLPGVAYSSVSRDGGRSWSPSQPEPALPNFRSKGYFGRDSQGRHVYVYNDTVQRQGLYYKVKPSEGTWSHARLFFGGRTRNSYPTLLEDKSGEFLAVWDSSDDPDKRRTRIRFGRLDLNLNE